MRVKLFAVFMTILMVSTLGIAQDVVSDVGKAAKATGRVTEKAAKGIEKAAKVSANGTEKAAAKTGHGVEKVVTKI